MSDAVAPTPGAPTPTNQNVPPPSANQPRSQQQPAQGAEPSAQDAPTASAPKAPEPEYFEIKVDGKTKRYTKDELIRRAQLADTATERFEKAAQFEKREQQLKQGAKADIFKTIRELNPDLTDDEIVGQIESYYTRKVIEPTKLSPAELRARELEEELSTYKSKEAEAKQKAEAEKAEKDFAQLREGLQAQIIEILESNRVPRNKATVARLAKWMRINNAKGFNAPNELLIAQVNKERRDEVRAELEGLTYQDMLDLLGEDGIGKIRKADLENLRASRSRNAVGQFAPKLPGVESNQPSGKVDMDEVTRRLRAMRSGK